jgi:hypothetical protein
VSEDTGSSLLTEGGTPNPAPAAPAAAPTMPSSAPPAVSDLFIDMDDDLKGVESVGKFTKDGRLNVRSVVKSYANLERMLGGEKVPVPKDGDQEGWDRFYAAAGRPEAPDKYEFKVPENLPEGFYDKDAEASFRTWAHQNGLNNRQAQALLDNYVTTTAAKYAEAMKAAETGKSEALNALKREHGQAFEGFMQTAKAALKQFGDEDFNAYLDQSGLGNDPRLIRIFGKIGRALMGDTQLKGAPQQQARTPADIDKAIAEHRSKHSAALYDKDHIEHKVRVAELSELYNLKHPEPAT